MFNVWLLPLHVVYLFQHLQSVAHRCDAGHNHEAVASGFLEIAATGVRRYIVEGASESLTLIVGRLWIAHELHLHAALLEDDLLATELLADSS